MALKFQLKIGLKESIVLNNVRFLLFSIYFGPDWNKSIVFKWTLFLLISSQLHEIRNSLSSNESIVEYYCL